jgi:hypothetical protein
MNEIRAHGLNEVRESLKKIVVKLRGIGAELAELSSSLPEPTQKFEARAELGGVIHIVQTDLLADAITTLDSAATEGIFGLRLEFHKRQAWRNL